MKLWLVGCTSRKRAWRCLAEQMYDVSELFRRARAHVLRSMDPGDRWGICSAKYGFLEPTTIIEPYEQRLDRSDRDAWGERVAAAIAERAPARVVSLLGEDYLGPLRSRITVPIDEPLRGLGIGRRIAFLGEA